MTVVGLPYTFKGQLATDAPVGGSPYGASTLAGGGRQPSEQDLDGARFQGRYVTEIARALVLGRRG
jgi:NAD(P)H dehydrogenase (quinone)